MHHENQTPYLSELIHKTETEPSTQTLSNQQMYSIFLFLLWRWRCVCVWGGGILQWTEVLFSPIFHLF